MKNLFWLVLILCLKVQATDLKLNHLLKPLESTRTLAPVPPNLPPEGYVAWPNGGGFVHKNAKVDKTAYIGKGSKIGECAIIEEEVSVTDTTLTCEQVSSIKLHKGAVIKSTQFTGNLEVGKTQVDGLKGKGKLQIRDDSRLFKINLNGELAIREKTTVEDSSFEGTVEIREKVKVKKTTFLGAAKDLIEIRENSTVENSKINTAVTVREGCTIRNSELSKGAEVLEHSVIENKKN